MLNILVLFPFFFSFVLFYFLFFLFLVGKVKIKDWKSEDDITHEQYMCMVRKWKKLSNLNV